MKTYDYTKILLELPSCAQDFISHLAVTNRSGTTRRSYVYELRYFFRYLCSMPKFNFPSSPAAITLEHLNSLKHQDIESFLAWAQGNGNGARALSRKQAAIKSLYKYLVREDLVDKDITLKLIPIKINRKMPKALEPEQIADLTEVLDSDKGLTEGQKKYHQYTEKRDRTIMLTFIGTGLRLSELCAINLTDIDFKNLNITVLGKGDKEAKVYFNEDVKELLIDYMDNERPRYAKKMDSNALFLSMRGTRISTHTVERIVKRYMLILSEMGYNTKEFSTHKLRSTTATVILRETGNLALVQDYLRHSDPRTTRQYAKILDEELKRAASVIKFR